MRLSLVRWVFSKAAFQKKEIYSHFRPCPLTLQSMLDFSRTGSRHEAYQFLRKELLVRIANTMKEIECLPEALLNTRELRDVTRWFEMSFSDLLSFEEVPFSEDDFERFSETVRHIYFRHSSVVETVAEGLIDLKFARRELPIPHRQLQYFLNRFYLMRISNRMLMNQHIMKFCKLPNFSMHDCDRIDANCDVEAIVEEAFDAAQFMCDSKYLTAPRMEKFFHNAPSIGEPIYVAYSPAHLYHMTFELFKNALRATVEHWGVNKSPLELPPVKVSLFLGNSNLTIKICDRGGGVPRGEVEKLFAYHYTTAPRPLKDDRCPMAGLGYGLPLSRLYAWYFHGDLVLTSYEGYGSDACIYIKSKPADAHEFLPYFNPCARITYRASSLDPAWVHDEHYGCSPFPF
ncbi:hypothetical protein M514_01629 [Trichuris suis]|uniref:Protein-serine/threonine kinase n=1 Tax=Trichuris suis TaxID=68888 RepID=A0A085N265_9BILA|nr:hypothetical protein M513_01629 [Trichuris suis]KFD63561.1 hypothetical protein M514_01629 [Trichuris suis]